jgi:hypothetical protein
MRLNKIQPVLAIQIASIVTTTLLFISSLKQAVGHQKQLGK